MPTAAKKPAAKPAQRRTVDKGVPKPAGQRQARPDTWAARLRELEVGDTESRSVRIPGEGAIASVITQTNEDLRNSFAAIIRNAKQRLPDAEFTVAAGDFRARDGDVVVTIAVTRVS